MKAHTLKKSQIFTDHDNNTDTNGEIIDNN